MGNDNCDKGPSPLAGRQPGWRRMDIQVDLQTVQPHRDSATLASLLQPPSSPIPRILERNRLKSSEDSHSGRGGVCLSVYVCVCVWLQTHSRGYPRRSQYRRNRLLWGIYQMLNAQTIHSAWTWKLPDKSSPLRATWSRSVLVTLQVSSKEVCIP